MQIKYPIIQSGLGSLAYADRAAAVSNASDMIRIGSNRSSYDIVVTSLFLLD